MLVCVADGVEEEERKKRNFLPPPRFPPPPRSAPQTNPELAVLLSCLKKDTKDRPQEAHIKAYFYGAAFCERAEVYIIKHQSARRRGQQGVFKSKRHYRLFCR